MHDTLTKAGASSKLAPIPGESHTRIVVALSHPDKAAVPAIVGFVGQFGG